MTINMARYRITWTGLSGLPGITTFYQDQRGSAPALLPAARTFFEAVKSFIPSGCTITYPNVEDMMDFTTGKIEARLSVTPPAVTNGAGTGNYNATTGVTVDWLTQTWTNGRNEQGRTFLVPLANLVAGTGGAPDATNCNSIATAATAFLTAMTSTLVIWHRPHKGQADGSLAPVTAARVPVKYAVLTSRRD